MSCYTRLILAYATVLNIESGETEHLLLKYGEVLVAELTHKHLLREARIARILRVILNVVHTFYEELLCYAERLAEFGCVDTSLCLVHNNHNVVGRLIVHHKSTIAVVYGTTRRKLHFLQESVGVGIFLIVIAHELQGEEAYYIYCNDSYSHST